jgi:hypothetical protein
MANRNAVHSDSVSEDGNAGQAIKAPAFFEKYFNPVALALFVFFIAIAATGILSGLNLRNQSFSRYNQSKAEGRLNRLVDQLKSENAARIHLISS